MAYPRSFLGLLLTGFTVVALPLVGALAYSAWNTERLAEQSRTAVFSASQAARASRSLVNRISSIERLAQQLAVVEDPALAADYTRVHRGFRQIADELLLLPLDEQQLAALKKTVELEQQLYELLDTLPRRRQDPRRISRIAAELAENAYEVLAISYLVADREVVRLELDLDKVNVEADPEKLRSIIDNLLGNAVKFTPAGGTIRVLTRAVDREAMVDVIDSGPGVPLEERESIFDSFFRGRAKASGRIEGTGLGLAIAREFVE